MECPFSNKIFLTRLSGNNLFSERGDEAEHDGGEVDEKQVNVLMDVADLESDTMEPKKPDDGDV